MELILRPLDGPFGMEIQGVDLREEVDTRTSHLLDNYLLEHQVLLFRNQILTDDQLRKVASLFGRVRDLPGGYLKEEKVHGVRHLSNLGSDNTPTGVHPERWSKLWHTDGGFSQPPAKATLLYCIRASKDGGATQFANMYAGLAAFTDSERRNLDTMDAIHDQDLARVFRYGRAVIERSDLNLWQRLKRWRRFLSKMFFGGVTIHPLIHHCKESCRSAIILGSDIWRVRGMNWLRGMRMVEELTQRAVRDEVIFSHTLQPGDAIVWDNRSLLHRVTEYDTANDIRVMRQVVILPT